MVHKLPFNLPFDGGGNKNGITVIDISNLEDVRYAFVDFCGMESGQEFQLMTPLSARQYLNAYYEESSGNYKSQFGQLIKDFESWNIIKVDSLTGAWPTAWKENEENVAERTEQGKKFLAISSMNPLLCWQYQ